MATTATHRNNKKPRICFATPSLHRL